jgi:hypothetical protein
LEILIPYSKFKPIGGYSDQEETAPRVYFKKRSAVAIFFDKNRGVAEQRKLLWVGIGEVGRWLGVGEVLEVEEGKVIEKENVVEIVKKRKVVEEVKIFEEGKVVKEIEEEKTRLKIKKAIFDW